MTRLCWAALAVGISLIVGCSPPPPRHVGNLGPDETHEPRPFGRFSHEEHEAAFAGAGWSCDSCHRLGAIPAGEPDPLGFTLSVEEDHAILLPPADLCHDCHAPGVSADAPTRCRLCHEEGENEAPESHAAGWEVAHRRDALLRPESCFDCHESWTCVRCHVRRDRIGHEVHPGTWPTLHGIAARTDPGSCEDCHEGASCQQCHRDKRGMQGW